MGAGWKLAPTIAASGNRVLSVNRLQIAPPSFRAGQNASIAFNPPRNESLFLPEPPWQLHVRTLAGDPSNQKPPQSRGGVIRRETNVRNVLISNELRRQDSFPISAPQRLTETNPLTKTWLLSVRCPRERVAMSARFSKYSRPC